MECAYPPPLSDDDISAAIEGLADGSIMEHLQNCPGCRARFDEEVQFDQRLKQQLYRWDCVSSDDLRDYVVDLVSGDQKIMIESHLQTCPRCRDEVRDLRAFISQDQEAQKPAKAIPQRTKLPSAVWMMKPVTGQQQFALRGSAPLMLETHGITLLLTVDLNNGNPVLMGRILTANAGQWIGSLVQVQQQGIFRTTVLVDKNGVFRSPLKEDLSIGLRITAPDRTILQVKDIDLKV